MMPERKLLIIEDDPMYAEILCAMLKMRRWSTVVASSMGEAEISLKTNKFSATILDLRLPDSDTLSSLDRIQALKELGAGNVIIITGANVTPEIELLAKISGADGILSKNELRVEGSLTAALKW